jgi:hypothetical protein
MNKLQRIQLNFVGDKGKDQIHSKSFLYVDTEEECLIIDWTNKTVDVYGKKRFKRHE